MIASLGPHGGYIFASFAAAGVILGWMIASSVLGYLGARRRLSALTKDNPPSGLRHPGASL